MFISIIPLKKIQTGLPYFSQVIYMNATIFCLFWPYEYNVPILLNETIQSASLYCKNEYNELHYYVIFNPF